MAPGIKKKSPGHKDGTVRLPLDWEALVSDAGAVKKFRAGYLDLFSRGETVDFAVRG